MKTEVIRALAGLFVASAFNYEPDRIFSLCNQISDLDEKELLTFLLNVSTVLCNLGLHLDKSATFETEAFLNELLRKGDLRP